MTYEQALNRLAKWRSIFAGWQLGTRSIADPESQAVRDQREAMLIMRVELNAVMRILTEKLEVSTEVLKATVVEECAEYQEILERRFPGAVATDDGMRIDTQKAREWMDNFLK